MEWHEKFKVGQEVRVVKKVDVWDGASWVDSMDKTLNKIYEVRCANEDIGYLLSTANDAGMSYWYPAEALEKAIVEGQQLLFSFYHSIKG